MCVEKSASGTSTHTAAILPRIEVAPWGRFCIFRSESEGEVGKTIEGGGGSLQTVAGGILPLHPLFGYYIVF